MSEDKWEIDDNMFNFLPEDIEKEKAPVQNYKILITDDEEEVHNITKILLKSFKFEGKGLEFVDAYSASEAIEIMENNDDIALIFLDVVMEESHSGLHVVKHIREVLKNSKVRIILRTGQPGEAPEEEIIRKYDINDYRVKTELTAKRLLTSLYTALRSYRDILKLEQYQRGLEKIIKASSNLFRNSSMNEFLVCILEELSTFTADNRDYIYLRSDDKQQSNGFVTLEEDQGSRIIAATGKYEKFIGNAIKDVPELDEISEYLQSNKCSGAERITKVSNGFIICNQNPSASQRASKNYVFIQGDVDYYDFEMIDLFLANFSIALDNFMLNSQLNNSQKEFVFALADTAETHFEETGHHVKRVSDMMYNFAILNNFSYQEAELLKLASTMHDLGKVSIPDKILKKPGRFTEEEYEAIKAHPLNGYNILKGSDQPILQTAAEIALNHHERFDGNGYPNGIEGKHIPLSARMMSLVDVYDAITHKRCYKDAISHDETIKMISENSGTQFDPELTKIFIDNIEEILQELPQ